VPRARERAPIPYPSVVFTFKLTVESTKEFGGASLVVKKKMVGIPKGPKQKV
jgi:hypothetical protein